MRRILLLCFIVAAAPLLLAGCGSVKNAYQSAVEAFSDHPVATTEHNAISLLNYKTAREYSAQNRFELAREHYLLAYAAAGDDPTLRESLRQELHSIDLMIKTMR